MSDQRILVNRTACDWLTLTTDSARAVKSLQMLTKELPKSAAKPASKMQYTGQRFTCDGGTLAHFVGEQSGYDHYMVECSGATADDVLKIATGKNMDVWRCTRIDLQRTRHLPEHGYQQQFELFSTVKDLGQTAGWASSRDEDFGDMATVYIGSRKSGRFVRVYQKEVKKQLWLRFECVFKRDGGSDELFQRLVKGRTDFTMDTSLEAIIKAVDIEQLNVFLAGVDATAVSWLREQSKTAKWLMEQCLPALSRVIAQHDGEAAIVELAFLDAIGMFGKFLQEKHDNLQVQELQGDN